MPRKDQMDAFGATSLVLFSALFGFNQVVIKLVNEGFQPVFAAGLRSLGAIPLILLWAWFRGHSLRILPGTVGRDSSSARASRWSSCFSSRRSTSRPSRG
jgi:drug/metabolite transporter (DMT)-like permease